MGCFSLPEEHLIALQKAGGGVYNRYVMKRTKDQDEISTEQVDTVETETTSDAASAFVAMQDAAPAAEESSDAPFAETNDHTPLPNGEEKMLDVPKIEAQNEEDADLTPAPPLPPVSPIHVGSRLKKKMLSAEARILTLTPERDLRYRGFLSYRGLRISAWLCLILAQIGVLLGLGAKLDPGLAESFGGWTAALSVFGSFMTPLFIMAAFGILLNNNSRRFRSLLALYGGFAILFVLLFVLLYDRYLIGMVMSLSDMSRKEASDLLSMLIAMFSGSGFFAYNIFIDLFLCTLFVCFLTYTPKKVFVGKKLVLFRSFAAIPVCYELACILLKALTSLEVMTMPVHLIPFLTTKPPLTFLIFVCLAFFIKKREWLFIRNGKTKEEYETFLNSNLNSWQFSKFAAKMFLIVSLVDLALMLVLGFALMGQFSQTDAPFRTALNKVDSWGIGACAPLIFVAPFLLLFSYTRTHKDSRPDLIINLVGIILLVLVYLEGLYQVAIAELDRVMGLIG